MPTPRESGNIRPTGGRRRRHGARGNRKVEAEGGKHLGSEWAKEAVRQAEEITRELAAAGHGFSLTYQRREARFALKSGGATAYFSAHDYETRKGTDWAQLRKDVLARAGGL